MRKAVLALSVLLTAAGLSGGTVHAKDALTTWRYSDVKASIPNGTPAAIAYVELENYPEFMVKVSGAGLDVLEANCVETDDFKNTYFDRVKKLKEAVAKRFPTAKASGPAFYTQNPSSKITVHKTNSPYLATTQLSKKAYKRLAPKLIPRSKVGYQDVMVYRYTGKPVYLHLDSKDYKINQTYIENLNDEQQIYYGVERGKGWQQGQLKEALKCMDVKMKKVCTGSSISVVDGSHVVYAKVDKKTDTLVWFECYDAKEPKAMLKRMKKFKVFIANKEVEYV